LFQRHIHLVEGRIQPQNPNQNRWRRQSQRKVPKTIPSELNKIKSSRSLLKMY
jgi:hypothetical protein